MGKIVKSKNVKKIAVAKKALVKAKKALPVIKRKVKKAISKRKAQIRVVVKRAKRVVRRRIVKAKAAAKKAKVALKLQRKLKSPKRPLENCKRRSELSEDVSSRPSVLRELSSVPLRELSQDQR